MLVRAYSPIAAGTNLSIELKQGERIRGVARWVDGDCVGIAFDEAMDVAALLRTSLEGRACRTPRIEIDCTATVRDDAKVVKVRATNISQGGLRVQAAGELPIDARVFVTIAGLGTEPATVKWRDGDWYGLAFNRVLAITQLVGWLQARSRGTILPA